MKQKRKVKSLLPQKEDRSALITALLLILSLILCVGSASLLTMSVGAASPEFMTQPISYTGLDDKSEVLYDMQFVDPEYMEKVMNKVYISGNSLYITGNSVVVNSNNTNQVSSGTNGNILGGDNNKLDSNNVTIIAGENNTVSGSDNSVILGGKNGQFNKYSDSSVSVGGKNNTGVESEQSVLIGGENNEVQNSESVFILGGKENSVVDADNVIIGGKGVKVNTVNNIFVFSNNGNFQPQTSNAFYLNVENGVGINVPSSEGLAVKGAVSLGYFELNVAMKPCNSGSLGVIGSWDGCLMGCTKKSMEYNGGWELLDRGEPCETACKGNNYCIDLNQKEVPEENSDENDYDSFCSSYPEYATPCFSSGSLENYKNVVFETNLIDSDVSCPTLEGENKCVFKCNSGYHLTGNVAGGDSSRKECYADCTLQWEDGEPQPLAHNETVIGYDASEITCTYSKKNKSIETCANHKKTLICNNGTVFVADGKGVAGKKATGKYYQECTLGRYKCPSDYRFNFRELEEIDGKPTREVDRSTGALYRGIYELCLDYKPVQGRNDICEVDHQENTYAEHYKLVACNSGYTTGAGYEYICKRQCTWQGVTKNHNQSYTFYKSGSETCTNVCQGATFTCDDGSWKNGVGESIEDYRYTGCTLNSQTCPGYNVTAVQYNEWSGNGIYEPCQKYNPNGNSSCIKTDIMYKLTECKPGFHTGDNENINICESNTARTSCDDDGIPANARINRQFVRITWSNGVWSSPARCGWSGCIDGYEETDDKKCISNECDMENETCKDSSAITGEVYNNASGHVWSCQGKTIKYCAKCNEGYYASGSEASGFVCMPNQDGKCGILKYECLSGTKVEITEYDSRYTRDCIGLGSGTSTESCVLCKEGYHSGSDNDCEPDVAPINGVCGSEPYTCGSGEFSLNGYEYVATGVEFLEDYWKITEKPLYQRNCLGNDVGSDDYCVKCDKGYYQSGSNCIYYNRNFSCRNVGSMSSYNGHHYWEVCVLKAESGNIICTLKNPGSNFFGDACGWDVTVYDDSNHVIDVGIHNAFEVASYRQTDEYTIGTCDGSVIGGNLGITNPPDNGLRIRKPSCKVLGEWKNGYRTGN